MDDLYSRIIHLFYVHVCMCACLQVCMLFTVYLLFLHFFFIKTVNFSVTHVESKYILQHILLESTSVQNLVIESFCFLISRYVK